MKGVQLTEICRLEVRDLPDPVQLGNNEVLLKPEAVGVCGSDIHYFLEGKIGDQIIDFPFIIGHECSAKVVRTGGSVRALKPGDLVVVEPAVSCHKCDQCLAGRPHTCRKLKFLGCPGQLSGCMSEYLVMPEENCFKVGPNITPEEAAFIEPLSIGCYAVKLLKDPDAKKIGVLGTGPIGLSTILALKASGVISIYATDKINRRLEIAGQTGADWTANPLETNIIDEIKRKEPLLLDAVFECCGKQEALDQAIEILKPGGKLIIVGIPSEERISFDISKLRRKEILIQNVRRQNNSIETAIELMYANREKIRNIITHHFPFEKSQEAFEFVAGYKDGVVKAIISFENKI